jgi:hypothetical protein
MHGRLPYIFILDWDGTIAGKVDFQSHQYSLHNTLKKHGFKPLKQHPIPPAFYPNAKLIRPGFTSFMKAIKKVYPDAQFFIYTASEKHWAHQEIVWTEKTHDIHFNRPIFTREDCSVDAVGNNRKSIARIFPRVMKSISKEYPLTSAQREQVLNTQLLIIDNNAVYTDRMDRLLLCPDYNYAVFENLLHGIPLEARKHPIIQQHLLSLINNGYLCVMPNDTDDGMKSLAKQYQWLAVKCKAIIDINTSYEHDDFWKFLKQTITQNQIKLFSPSIIRQLQDAAWKNAKAKKSQSNH